MCDLVFSDGRRPLATTRELADVLGDKNIVFRRCDGIGWVPPAIDDSCLCHVDVQGSAVAAGWASEWDPFGFKLIPPGSGRRKG